MRISFTVLGGLGLVAFGYALGALQVLSAAASYAQPAGAKASGRASAVELTDETKNRIKAAADSLRAAADALVDEGKYTPATKGVNGFAVLTGGVNALRDLENNAVVDPETFAALYANLATDNVAVELSRDGEGRLMYKGKVIRIYPLSRLRALYGIRGEITSEELLPTIGEAAEPAKGSSTGSPTGGGR
ncbi:MAG: hypothetical protein ACT4QC_11590 [Planctomycetaceae bacterium]